MSSQPLAYLEGAEGAAPQSKKFLLHPTIVFAKPRVQFV